MSSYQAGSCNIGKQEIRRRQIVAAIGLVLTLITLIGFYRNGTPASSRVYIFLPAMIFTTGYVQATKKFCLAYGFMGTFNLGKLGDISKVASKEDKKADRTTAIKILLQATEYAAIIAAVVYFLPIS